MSQLNGDQAEDAAVEAPSGVAVAVEVPGVDVGEVPSGGLVEVPGGGIGGVLTDLQTTLEGLDVGPEQITDVLQTVLDGTDLQGLQATLEGVGLGQGQIEGVLRTLLEGNDLLTVLDGLGLGDDQIAGIFQTLATGLGQTIATAGLVASSVTQDIISAALDGDITPNAGSVSPLIVSANGASSSQYIVSGYQHRSHDGFSVQSSNGLFSGVTPGFEEENYGLTIGGRFDGSDMFGAAPNTVTLGVFGNYTRTEIDVDGIAGVTGGSTATVDSWSVGTFGLVTDGTRYGLVTVTGTFGSPETETDTIAPASAEFNNYALATSAVAGVLIPVGGSARLDLRGGLDYIHARSDDFEDSLGVAFTDGQTEELSGNLSARLFSVIKQDGYVVRPFIQTGVSYRFLYENELKVDGIAFSFDQEETTFFGRAGVDFSLSQSAQAYLAVRGDISEDSEAIAAQVGITFILD